MVMETVNKKPKFTLQPNETVLLEVQPSQKIATYWLLNRLAWWIAIVIAIYLACFAGILPQTPHPLVASILITLLIMAAAWLWINFLRQFQRYTITNQRCILYWGFLTLQKQLIPHNRIVDLNMQQTFIERLLGIGSVTLNVPSIIVNNKGRQQNLLVLYGLPKETCEQVMSAIGQTPV